MVRRAWEDFVANDNAVGLTFAVAPSTQSVRLSWQAQGERAAGGYRIYRNLFPITPAAPGGCRLLKLKTCTSKTALICAPLITTSVVALNKRAKTATVATYTTVTRVIASRG